MFLTIVIILSTSQNAVWGGFVALFLIYFAGIGATLFFLKKKMAEEPGKWTWKSIIYEITFRNVMELRDQLASTIGFLPRIWAFMMKQFIPHVILILFINLAQSKAPNGKSLFGNYELYADWPYQIMGYGTVLFALGLFLIGFFFPDLYSGLTLVDDKLIMHGYGQGVQEAQQKQLEGDHEGEGESDDGKMKTIEQPDEPEPEVQPEMADLEETDISA